jgi:hypothetical protein
VWGAGGGGGGGGGQPPAAPPFPPIAIELCDLRVPPYAAISLVEAIEERPDRLRRPGPARPGQRVPPCSGGAHRDGAGTVAARAQGRRRATPAENLPGPLASRCPAWPGPVQ